MCIVKYLRKRRVSAKVINSRGLVTLKSFTERHFFFIPLLALRAFEFFPKSDFRGSTYTPDIEKVAVFASKLGGSTYTPVRLYTQENTVAMSQ